MIKKYYCRLILTIIALKVNIYNNVILKNVNIVFNIFNNYKDYFFTGLKIIIMLLNLIAIGKNAKIIGVYINVFFIKSGDVYNKIYFKIKLEFKVKACFGIKSVIYKRFYSL